MGAKATPAWRLSTACTTLVHCGAPSGAAWSVAPPRAGLPGGTDHAAPLGAPQWTKVVQAVLKRQAGVAFAPKDLRSSFITFLMSDENSDEVVKKAVAHAMRHSTAQQASPAYDKERAERTWAAAVQVAGSYAARFK